MVIGNYVEWMDNVPTSWRFIYSEGPMEIMDIRYQDGAPSKYHLCFGPNGFDLIPGNLLYLRCTKDNPYYNSPPLLKDFMIWTHEKWVRLKEHNHDL